MHLPVETIGTRFGGIPQSLPGIALPTLSWDTVRQLLMPTLTIALLGAIGVAPVRARGQPARHGRTPPQARPQPGIDGQGVANFVVPFWWHAGHGHHCAHGDQPALGALAPIAGIVHAATLGAIVLLAAPLALHIPLAVLAGILLCGLNMGEWHEFVRLRHFSNHYRLLMLGTFFLTVVSDLTVAVEVGLVLACVLFVRRMSALFRADPCRWMQKHPARLGWSLHGALFFGAAAKIDPLVQAIEAAPHGVQVKLDMRHLFALDTTGLDGLGANPQGGSPAWRHLTVHDGAGTAQLMERSGSLPSWPSRARQQRPAQDRSRWRVLPRAGAAA
jgi:SulP family sulfate permease